MVSMERFNQEIFADGRNLYLKICDNNPAKLNSGNIWYSIKHPLIKTASTTTEYPDLITVDLSLVTNDFSVSYDTKDIEQIEIQVYKKCNESYYELLGGTKNE